jgi:hypothetical protein
MAQALNTALHDAMEADDRVVVFGEDVGVLGGVFRITDKLQERFGDKRCFDTPLAESGIVGSAVGMAMYGFRPVVEMQFDGFTYPAFEQIVSHVAKMRNRSRGTVKLPITIRIPFGGGIGAVEHHSESPENYFAHVAGLKIVSPGTPSDGYSLLHRVHRLGRPGHLLRAEAPLLAEGGRRAAGHDRADRSGRRPPPGHHRDAVRLRPRWCARAWTPPRPPRRRAGTSRSSTCARSTPSTMTPSSPP